MIEKCDDGYYVVSEKTEKNLGGPYKTRKKPKKGFAKWNILNTKKIDSLKLDSLLDIK